jgi:hypothetical protein
MSTGKSKNRNFLIISIFILIWIAFIAILYIGFQNRTVIEYRVVQGVVGGQKTFLESRSTGICFGTILWGILFGIVLWRSNK